MHKLNTGLEKNNMNLEAEIINQFIAPDGSNRQHIEDVFQNVAKQLVDFLANANKYPSSPELKIQDEVFFELPKFPKSTTEILDKLQCLYHTSMNPANPKYIGHMDSVPTIWSIMGDFVASAINNNMLSVEMSPFLTQLEYSITAQFARLFGMPMSSGGVLCSGGTIANFQALLIARNTKLNIVNGNVYGLQHEPVIFTSEHSHVSIQKIGMMMGIGLENVIKIRADRNSRMDIEDLKLELQKQKNIGKQPFAIVATMGTTVSGNIDPLSEIAEVAQQNNLWLHVDAIYGGAVAMTDEYKHLAKGCELANSISFNPQKWLYVAKTSSMVLFRDFEAMVNNFKVDAPYMKEQSHFINLGEVNVQGTKHAEILKLWLSLLCLGNSGYKKLINKSFKLADIFVKEIEKRSYLHLVSEPELNIICFRAEFEHLNDKETDVWNRKLQEYLNSKSCFFLSLPHYKNNLWLRAVILNPFFTDKHIYKLFEEIERYRREIVGQSTL